MRRDPVILIFFVILDTIRHHGKNQIKPITIKSEKSRKGGDASDGI